jgi:hypothetical protein
MSQVNTEAAEEQIDPIAQVRIVYLGPVEPHWELQAVWGDDAVIDAFRDRVNARLILLPPHDPQFRRNRERVNRDGEREAILVDWDLGFPEETPAAPAPTEA